MTTRHVLCLEPVDVWSFRDGRPFDVGEAFEARSMFPPSPWSTLGCIRTALLRQHCGDPERYAGRPRGDRCPVCDQGPCHALPVVGEAGGQPPFTVGPPLPCRRGDRTELLFPCPADVVKADKADKGQAALHLLAPLTLPDGAARSSPDLMPVGVPVAEDIKPLVGHYVTARELEAWSRGEAQGKAPADDDPEDRIFLRESRVGIGIAPGRNAVETGHLYVRDTIRLRENFALAVPCDRDLGLAGEVGRLGGDGRLVRFAGADQAAWPAIPKIQGPRVKLCFGSPTWVREGANARSWRRMLLERCGDGLDLRVVAIAVSGSPALGGWDLQKQQPREMRRLLGAGSVIFIEVRDGDPGRLVEAVHGQHLCDDPAMAAAGFGLAFAGGW